MSNIICIKCGNEVKRTGSVQKYCEDCRKSAYREREVAYFNKNREANLEKKRKYQNNYRKSKEHKENHDRWLKENKEKCKERASSYCKKFYKENIEEITLKAKEYYKNNKDKIYKRNRIKYKNNPKLRINTSMGRRVSLCLKGKKMGRKWEDILGYTIKDLMNNLQLKFKEGMSWDNYGKWHIDHIKPVKLFKFTSEYDEDFKECWKLSNLQPLWAKENMSKGSKYG